MFKIDTFSIQHTDRQRVKRICILHRQDVEKLNSAIKKRIYIFRFSTEISPTDHNQFFGKWKIVPNTFLRNTPRPFLPLKTISNHFRFMYFHRRHNREQILRNQQFKFENCNKVWRITSILVRKIYC